MPQRCPHWDTMDLFSTSSPARLQRSDSCPGDSLTRCWFRQKSYSFKCFHPFPSLAFIYATLSLPTAPSLQLHHTCGPVSLTGSLNRSGLKQCQGQAESCLRDKVRLPLQRDGAAEAAQQTAQGGLRALFPPFELPRSPKSHL